MKSKVLKWLWIVVLLFGAWICGQNTAKAVQSYSCIDDKKVAITFDDGPNPQYTELLLDGLRERNVRATFFLIGKQAEEYPDLVKKMDEDGHLIGNHTYSHVDLCKQSEEGVVEQVDRTNDIIEEITGKRPVYIRPPFGSWNRSLEEQTGMLEIFWTVDPRDWECTDCSRVIERTLEDVKDGSILLFHDASPSSVRAALAVVDILKERGYEFVTADELIYE